mmetsp:Transcript_8/g.20  ORF Transcript_8/g.20 Transcript_8/m.20 type:complete len:96 (-) Transcript_8:517-804(-)
MYESSLNHFLCQKILYYTHTLFTSGATDDVTFTVRTDFSGTLAFIKAHRCGRLPLITSIMDTFYLSFRASAFPFGTLINQCACLGAVNFCAIALL